MSWENRTEGKSRKSERKTVRQGPPPLSPSRSLPPARAPRARRAAEAMPGRDDAPPPPRLLVEVCYMRAARQRDLEIEHLVEVAVVEPPVPADGERVAAHEPLDRARVVGIHQPLHVRLEIAARRQPFQEAGNRHVVEHEQAVEGD